jgi:hypothetical protein|tara:strand:+ start:2148 stop:3140 length:993 start_codon:yes stop_codon:yes gene_type:complete
MSEEVSAAPEAVVEESVEVSPEATEVVEAGSEAVSEASGEVLVEATTEAELEAEIEQAVEEGASEEEVQSMVREFVLKVDGKEFTKEIDLNDEEAVRAELQKAYKGQLTMQEKAEQEKLFKEFLENVQSDPFKMIKQLNPDFDEVGYASTFFDDLLKEQEMTPEQKEASAKEMRYNEAIERADRLEKEANDRTRNEENAKLTAGFKNSIEEALNADTELKSDPMTVSRVAHHMHQAALKGIELEPKQVLDSVKKEIRDQFKRSAGMLKDQNLLSKYMGEDLTEQLRKARVEKVQKKVPNAATQTVAKADQKDEQKKRIKLSDLRRGGAFN